MSTRWCSPAPSAEGASGTSGSKAPICAARTRRIGRVRAFFPLPRFEMPTSLTAFRRLLSGSCSARRRDPEQVRERRRANQADRPGDSRRIRPSCDARPSGREGSRDTCGAARTRRATGAGRSSLEVGSLASSMPSCEAISPSCSTRQMRRSSPAFALSMWIALARWRCSSHLVASTSSSCGSSRRCSMPTSRRSRKLPFHERLAVCPCPERSHRPWA